MAFAPFPASDLAKLVLGYLMEEQLMTAYDEFLQASPYLDAFVNEYDRLCMISLRNILSEYRAMRLLVETCKPVELRRKLLQCSNLYDMVKLLVTNVDLKKLCEKDTYADHFRPKIAVLNCKRNTPNKSQNATKAVNQFQTQMRDTPLKPSLETPLKHFTDSATHDSESMFSDHMDETDPITQVSDVLETELVSQEPLSEYEPINESEPNNDSMVLEDQSDPVLEEPVTGSMQTEHINQLEQIDKVIDFRQTDCVTHFGCTHQISNLERLNQLKQTKISDLGQTHQVAGLGKIEQPNSLKQKEILNLKQTMQLGQSEPPTKLAHTEPLTNLGQKQERSNLQLTNHITQLEQPKQEEVLDSLGHLGQQEQLTYLKQKEQITQSDQIQPKFHSSFQPSTSKVETKSLTDLPVSAPAVINLEQLNGLKSADQNVQSINLNIPLPAITSDIQRVYKQLATNFSDYCSSVKEIKPTINTESSSRSETPSTLYSNTVPVSKISPEFQPLPEINSNFLPSVNSTKPNRLENVPVPLCTPVNLSNTETKVPNTNIRDSQKIIILSDVKFDSPQPQNMFCNPIHPLCYPSDSQRNDKFGGNNAEKRNYTENETMANSQPQNMFCHAVQPLGYQSDSQKNDQFKENNGEKCIYTEDEIMAMPTVFVASPADTKFRRNRRQPSKPSLKSLLVEVPDAESKPIIDITDGSRQKSKKTKSIPPQLMHLKTIEPNNTSNVQPHTLVLTTSKPNEITVSSRIPLINKITDVMAVSNDINESNSMPSISDTPKTPNAPLPVKKPSSTPRRSSHIRVLDFTTPRRPLSEAILENCVSEEDAVLSKNPNMINLATRKPEGSSLAGSLIEQTACIDNNIERKINPKTNWDADLRALLVNNEEVENKCESKIKNKIHKRKKKPPEYSNEEKKDKKEDKKDRKEKKKSKSHKHQPNKLEKNKDKANESVEAPTEILNVKPSIKVITERKISRDSAKDDKNDKYAETLPPQEGTPEVDPIFLQHDIGAKLSISDILETPYKQAIYDLQMETPRFLGPEFAGDPLSDIKIMNIPTPRFLSTPKLQSTPSYSSRPTDYSSGGSYYKPDDNDYPTIVDDLILPATSSPIEEVPKCVLKINTPLKVEDKPQSKPPNNRQSSRPVRKCTKNVSYYDIVNNKYSSTPTKNADYHSSDNNKNRASNDTEPKSKSKTDSTKKRSTPKINPRVKKTPNMKIATKSKKITSLSNRRANCKDLTTIVIKSPAKSRRKSSTPRKLHCTKTFNSLHEQEPLKIIKEDSEKEEAPSLRWGNDSSRESKCEVEDIAKIQEYIDKTAKCNTDNSEDPMSNKESALLQLELIKRGFDVATAAKIERDLTDKPSTSTNNSLHSVSDEVKKNLESNKNEVNRQNNESAPKTTQNTDSTNADIDEEYEEDLEFSVNECDEHCPNFIEMEHDERHIVKDVVASFKDTFCMEVCIEDDVIRLNTTPFVSLFTEEPEEVKIDKIDIKSNESEKDESININEVYDFSDSYIRHYQEETEAAVQSISGFGRFRTPRKELTADEAKCVEIFDSSLASLDTPMKTYSPKHKRKSLQEEEKVNVFLIEQSCSGAEVTVEIESIEEITSESHTIPKKRKRSISTKEEGNISKISKTIKNLKSIQNIDIETVLSRLHGP